MKTLYTYKASILFSLVEFDKSLQSISQGSKVAWLNQLWEEGGGGEEEGVGASFDTIIRGRSLTSSQGN